jgi:hypothetical protein
MRRQKIGLYLVCAWAEPVERRFQGLASIDPSIPNSWRGGPDGASLIVDSMHDSAEKAEEMALAAAIDALMQYLRP